LVIIIVEKVERSQHHQPKSKMQQAALTLLRAHHQLYDDVKTTF
jgi:hypothetical protein